MTKERNREEQLERLFKTAGPLPELTPEPLLPMRVRALAASDVSSPAAARPRWAWLSLAGAAFALSMIVGGYIGYGAWSSTEQTAVESTDDAEILVTAWLQSGFVEDLDQSDAAGDEVTE
jgi:hypothetical protein